VSASVVRLEGPALGQLGGRKAEQHLVVHQGLALEFYQVGLLATATDFTSDGGLEGDHGNSIE